MGLVIGLYILTLTLLILHEIESAYWEEWKILHLPGRITGFLLMHFPLFILLFYGLLELYLTTTTGLIAGIVCGISGIIPLLVHNLLVRREGKFQLPISQIIIWFSAVSGVSLFILILLERGEFL